jgi:hypothetical protein
MLFLKISILRKILINIASVQAREEDKLSKRKI